MSVGLAIRLAISLATVGSNDARIWEHIAEKIHEVGLIDAYRALPGIMNHPVLPACWALAARAGSGLFSFYFLMRLPAILADAVSTVLLASVMRGNRWALPAMALNPVAFLLSGYHCNTDNVMACLSLWSAVELHRRHFFRGGLALGAAINVKLIPVLLIPAAISLCRKRHDLQRLAAGLALCVLPYLPLLIHPALFWDNVLSYRSGFNRWGMMLMLEQLAAMPVLSVWAVPLAEHYELIGRVIIIGGVLALAVDSFKQQRWNAIQLFLITYAIFLFFITGFGVQYLAIVVPLMIAVDVKAAWRFGVTGGLFLVMVYGLTLVESDRLESHLHGRFPIIAALFGWLAWWTLGEVGVDTWFRPASLESESDRDSIVRARSEALT